MGIVSCYHQSPRLTSPLAIHLPLGRATTKTLSTSFYPLTHQQAPFKMYLFWDFEPKLVKPKRIQSRQLLIDIIFLSPLKALKKKTGLLKSSILRTVDDSFLNEGVAWSCILSCGHEMFYQLPLPVFLFGMLKLFITPKFVCAVGNDPV